MAAHGDYADHLYSGGNFKFVNDPIEDSMVISVVRNVDITPHYKSIYAGQTDKEFTFEILHGSGHFDYKINATQLVRDFKLTDR
jgi:hypothetical protein